MTWRPTPPNPAVISDGFKEIGAAYKATVTDNNSGAGRSSQNIDVNSDYKCIDLTNIGSAVLFRIGLAASLTNFDGVLPGSETGGVPKRIKLPKGFGTTSNRIYFITVATGSSPAATVYVTAYKELS